jgi:uncharacterized protein YndB with AHSA1/START domain
MLRLALLLFLVASPSDPVVTEATVNAPVDAVWRGFTTKAGLEAWLFGKTEIDLKVGGLWLTNYSKTSDLHDSTTIQQTILAFDPGRMMTFRTTKPPADFPYPQITQTWTVVYFEPIAPNKTRILVRMFGFGDDEQSQKMRAFFERGNKSEMDKAVKFFEDGIPEVLR